MRKILNFIKGIIISVWVLVAIVTTVLLITKNEFFVSELGKFSVIIIGDEKNEPDFHDGDVVIIKKSAEGSYNEGDKVFFYLTNNETVVNLANIKKIVKHDFAEDSYYFSQDVAVGHKDMIGKASGSIVYHKVGKILKVFESSLGFMFFIILPTIFAIVYEIYSIIEEAKREDEE